jgi:hypothetical protein
VSAPAAERLFSSSVSAHEALTRRRNETIRRVAQARDLISSKEYFRDPGVTVFAAGSMGRADMGVRSDLDLFLLATKAFNDAEKNQLIECLDDVNLSLGYPQFMNRRYVKVYDLGDLLRKTGSPQDDSENYFTARMLLLLEAQPLVNDQTFRQIRDQILSQYFRDERGKSSYRPLFVLNDILRFWRTLCLNYETLRHEAGRPWWKKNISLKFSRMLTVYATVAVLTVRETSGKSDFEGTCDLVPLDRLSHALDMLNDQSLAKPFTTFLNDYETFLAWKEDESIDQIAEGREFQDKAQVVADRFSDFLYSLLMNDQIPPRRRKYLVI